MAKTFCAISENSRQRSNVNFVHSFPFQLSLTFSLYFRIAEAVARMRRRSASSMRSSGRRRVESARSHRYVERSLSACSGMSRPGTAPASRSRVEQAEEPSRIEPVERQEASLETKDMVTPIGGAEIEEATSVHEDEQGRHQGHCRHVGDIAAISSASSSMSAASLSCFL